MNQGRVGRTFSDCCDVGRSLASTGAPVPGVLVSGAPVSGAPAQQLPVLQMQTNESGSGGPILEVSLM